jgi:tripartite-type tricarboxylate transporter receptor subunit TctC
MNDCTSMKTAPVTTRVRCCIVLVALSVWVLPAASQMFPIKPVRVVAPVAQGGVIDIISRIFSAKMFETSGQPVVVENRAGASGNIGTEYVVRAPADGYTLLVHGVSNALAMTASLRTDLPFDPVTDLAPISLLGYTDVILVVTPSLPVRTVSDLIAYAVKQPGKLNYGSSGNGASGHLNMELFRSMAKIELTHVPYKVVNQTATDLVGGRIQLWMSPVPGVLPFIRNGQMRALAIASETRNPALPDVPLIKETQGLERYFTSTTYALFAPAKTPREVIGRLNTEVRRVVATQDMKEKLAAAGVEPKASSPEEVSTMLKTEIQKWTEVVKAAKITAD